MERDILEELYQTYYRDVYTYLLALSGSRHLAEELAQETFLRAFCKVDIADERIKSWLLRTAHNAFIDYVRKESRAAWLDDEVIRQVADHRPGPEQQLEQKEEVRRVYDIVAGLPWRQRQALALRDGSGLSYVEAARLMGITVGAFRNLLLRARSQVRQQMKGGGEP
ncbi:MAG: RNA polymerase sigma factor [Eubacteriales bacterium]